MVLFCAYMQWSPAVDLDYVWINGHEHYVGAANQHQMDSIPFVAAATHFQVTAEPPTPVTAGSPFGFTVTALDPYNNTVTGFTGTIPGT